MTPDASRKHLVLAVLLAGAGGVGLVAVGWWIVGWRTRDDWGRLSDAGWLTSFVLRTLGHLSFGGVGLKIALAIVVGVSAVFVRLRYRRRRQTDEPDL